MKIKFSEEEVDDLLQILENYDCLGDWELRVIPSLQAKIKRAKSASICGHQKALYLEAHRDGVLAQYKKLLAEKRKEVKP